jgi:hypothetical protein
MSIYVKKLIASITGLVTKYLRQFGVMSPLNYDQQILGAQAVMNLHETGSLFYLAEADAGSTMYTVWQGSEDNKPYAITVTNTGHATNPVVDSSKIGDCKAFAYPPKLSCGAAQQAMSQAGITDAWNFCRLRQSMDPVGNPFYDFAFNTRGPVRVDAVTGQVTSA